MYDFKTFAQMNLDLIFKDFQRIPEPGEEVFADSFTLQLGGGAQVIPLVLHDLGLSVQLGTFMSADEVGDICRMLLAKRGFSEYTDFDVSAGSPVVVTSVFSWPHDRAFLTHNEQVRESWLSDDTVYRFLQDAKIAFAPDGHPEVVRTLQREGVVFVYDNGWRDDLSIHDFEAILPYIHVFTPNDKEAMKMTGTKTVPEALRVLGDYTPHPCVTLGDQGCALWENGSITYIPACKRFQAVDTTGAGDNFLAGVIYGLIREKPLSECMRIGNIFAAYSTSAVGCYGRRFSKEFIQKYVETDAPPLFDSAG